MLPGILVSVGNRYTASLFLSISACMFLFLLSLGSKVEIEKQSVIEYEMTRGETISAMA